MMRISETAALGAILLLAIGAAGADEPGVMLRMATQAPDGTAWAREVKAFARDAERATSGAVRMKWYFGGVAGDELAVIERIRRGQLDGGGMTTACEQLAPSLRVLEVVGLVQTHAEADEVLRQLRPVVHQEFQASSVTALYASGAFGNAIFFTREPVQSFADLRRQRIWIWDLAKTLRIHLSQMGIALVPLPLDEANRAYEEGRTDGFVAIPSGALAFQFSARARFFTDIRSGFLPGCLLVANRAFDRLPNEQQAALRAAAAKFRARFEDVGRQTDEALMGGVFQRQGLQPAVMSESLRAQFFEEARAARERLGDALVPKALLARVLGLLADYRAEHRGP